MLSLAVSIEVAFITPIILMAQKRQQRDSHHRNHLGLQINLLAEQEATEQLRLLRLLCDHLHIADAQPKNRALEKATKPGDIMDEIRRRAMKP